MPPKISPRFSFNIDLTSSVNASLGVGINHNISSTFLGRIFICRVMPKCPGVVKMRSHPTWGVVLEIRLTEVEGALISWMPQSKARRLGGLFQNKGAFRKKKKCSLAKWVNILFYWGTFQKWKIAPFAEEQLHPIIGPLLGL